MNDTLSAITHNYAIYARSCSGAQAARHFSAFLECCYWTHHLIAHPMIEEVGSRVRATARVTATHLQRRLDGSINRWLVRGSYHDTFERRGSGWLIVRRDCFCLDADGDFESEGIKRYPELEWARRELLG
ncbi:MAG: hypothetical protein EXR86_05065 [Gammaproteobacteria bacterium]|nr:hypothetical protein [Gammaproteobacteria bacterium]